MNIVTGGCSFSETRNCIDYHRFGMMDNYDDYQIDGGYKSWALHLEDIIPNSKVYNTAMPGAGNGYISRAVIYKVNEMLEQGEKPDYVFIQFTACDRKELLLNVDDASTENDRNLLTHFIPSLDGGMDTGIDWNKVKEQNNNMLWLKHSYTDESMMKHWYKYYHSIEVGYLKTLEHILRLQWFFKANDINYKMFCGWGLFHELPKIPRQPIELRHLWSMVEWDNFWFHKRLGGITEWSRDNLPFEERFVTGDRKTEDGNALDEHPSNKAHKTFAKEVVSKWINNT
jgi:hypothetical protein|tara:strand:+ start:519 stop:1373 length:855 start_codon:yes stop_codon:yes gene_type:complete